MTGSHSVDEELVYRLIPLLYDAVIDPAGYRPFVDALAEHFGCPVGIVLREGHRIDRTWAGLHPEFESAHANPDWASDPWALAHERVPLGKVTTLDELETKSAVERTSFFAELCSFGLTYVVSLAIARTEDEAFSVFVMPRAKDEQDACVALLGVIEPHLTRIHQIRRRLGRKDSQPPVPAEPPVAAPPESARLSANEHPHPVFVVDRSLAVIVKNSAADAFLAQGSELSVRHGQLGVAGHASGQIRSLLEECSNAAPAGLRLEGELDHEHLLIVTGDAKRKSRFLVHVIERRSQRWLPPQQLLERIFRLTHTEARVALAVAEGKTSRELSEEFGITNNTARVHIQRILEKTECRRQTELALLVLHLGAIGKRSTDRAQVQGNADDQSLASVRSQRLSGNADGAPRAQY